jgi:hypothetical protein
VRPAIGAAFFAVAAALFLDAIRAFAGNRDVLTFAVPARLLDFDFLAFPAADFAEAVVAAAVGAAGVVTACVALTCAGDNEEEEQQSVHNPIPYGQIRDAKVSTDKSLRRLSSAQLNHVCEAECAVTQRPNRFGQSGLGVSPNPFSSSGEATLPWS